MPSYSGVQYGAIPTYPNSPGGPVAPNPVFGLAPPGGTFGGLSQQFDLFNRDPATGEQFPAANPNVLGDENSGFVKLLRDQSNRVGVTTWLERARLRNQATLFDAIQGETANDAQRKQNLRTFIQRGQDNALSDLPNRNLGLGQNVLDTLHRNMNELATDTDTRRDAVGAGQSALEQQRRNLVPTLMAMTAQRGDEASRDINRQAGQQFGSSIANRVGSGMYNTTMLDADRRNVEEQRSRSQRRLADNVLGQNLQLQEQLTGDAIGEQERGVQRRGQYDQPLTSQLAQSLSQAGQIGESQRATDTALLSDLTSKTIGFAADDMAPRAPTLSQIINIAMQGPTAQPYPLSASPSGSATYSGSL